MRTTFRRTLRSAMVLVVFGVASAAFALPPKPGGGSCESCTGPGGNRFCTSVSTGGYPTCKTDTFGNCTVEGALCSSGLTVEA